MNDIIKYSVIGFVSIIWLYIAARMITRAIIRTIEERKNRNG